MIWYLSSISKGIVSREASCICARQTLTTADNQGGGNSGLHQSDYESVEAHVHKYHNNKQCKSELCAFVQ